MADSNHAFPGQEYPGSILPTPNHIRLVSLLSGTTDAITCELVTIEIQLAPEYEALSYTWGDVSDCQWIYIQSAALQQPIELLATSNCASALRRLRYKDRPRMLWVDSLCINQSDISERNHQVTLMSKIYSQATNVVIYLGAAEDNSDLAVEFITECDIPSPETTSLSYPKSELLSQALDSFFRRPWFTRVWVIQEVVLSNSGIIYCGEKELFWSAIKNFNTWNTATKWLQKLPFVVSASKRSLVKDNIESSMFRALDQVRHCGATDQRDKIYGLLPLFQSLGAQINIIPNYGDTIAKVYTNCATVLFPDCGFELLYAVQERSSIHNLPSWVPDWSSPLKRSLLSRLRVRRYWLPEEQSHDGVPRLITRNSTNNSENTASLRVAGHLCGRILDIGSAYIAGRGPLPIAEWKRLAFGDAVINPKFEGIQRAESAEFTFHAVLASSVYGDNRSLDSFVTGDTSYFIFPLEEEDSDEMSWTKMVREMASERSGEKLSEGYILPFEDIPFHEAAKGFPLSNREYVQTVLKACHSRRFFITDTGYMGIAPEDAQIMDHVYICDGAVVPFVFREIRGEQHNQEPKQFQLIGESYVEHRAWKDLGKGFSDLEII